eukprot:7648407-Lingulodinium_polyedra.AAC.1
MNSWPSRSSFQGSGALPSNTFVLATGGAIVVLWKMVGKRARRKHAAAKAGADGEVGTYGI